MKSKKKYLALFITISLLLTACDNVGMSKENEQVTQQTEKVVGTSYETQPIKLQGGVENVLQTGSCDIRGV